MSALSIDSLHVRFGSVPVLNGIDLNIESGEFIVLVGPSGCGKSTLLNVIAGLEKAQAGRIAIGGRDVSGVAPKDRDIAMVFQTYALYPAMSVRKNITFGMECRGISKAERITALDRVASLLQIEHLLDRKPSQLSGGQRQRVAMGRALVRDPILFLFDEPLSNLDAKLRIEMRSEIKRLHQRLGTTIVYVTHDQVEAMTLATRIAVMNSGEIQQFADPQTVYDHPANLFVARFMGAPPMNTIPVYLEDNGEAFMGIIVQEGATVAKVRLPHRADKLRPYNRKTLLLGVRPECIDLIQSTDRDVLHVKGRVELVEPTGAETMVVFTFGSTDVVARVDADARPTIGSTVDFLVDVRKSCLFDPESGQRIA